MNLRVVSRVFYTKSRFKFLLVVSCIITCCLGERGELSATNTASLAQYRGMQLYSIHLCHYTPNITGLKSVVLTCTSQHENTKNTKGQVSMVGGKIPLTPKKITSHHTIRPKQVERKTLTRKSKTIKKVTKLQLREGKSGLRGIKRKLVASAI